MHDDDPAVFFDDSFWSVQVTRERALVDAVTFPAILGEADAAALDGHALAPRRQIAYATGPDVVDGDTLIIVGQGALARFSGSYRAREPGPVNDGLESRCLLQLIAPA